MADFPEIDTIRARWEKKAATFGFPDPDGLAPTSPRGLARRFGQPTTRIILLPGDPFRTDLEFDDPFWQWWDEVRKAPFGGVLPWTESFPTVEAAVRVRSYDREWRGCLALHRYGGIEVISEDGWKLRDESRVIPLVRTVALIWIALDAQAKVSERFEVAGPWQILVARSDTLNAMLGNVAKGWAEPREMFSGEAPRCSDPNVLVVLELETLPTGESHLRDLAFRLGGRIEDAWGRRERRFLINGGDSAGQFDPRGWHR